MASFSRIIGTTIFTDRFYTKYTRGPREAIESHEECFRVNPESFVVNRSPSPRQYDAVGPKVLHSLLIRIRVLSEMHLSYFRVEMTEAVISILCTCFLRRFSTSADKSNYSRPDMFRGNVINYRESRFVRYVDLKLNRSKSVAALWDFWFSKKQRVNLSTRREKAFVKQFMRVYM